MLVNKLGNGRIKATLQENLFWGSPSIVYTCYSACASILLERSHQFAMDMQWKRHVEAKGLIRLDRYLGWFDPLLQGHVIKTDFIVTGLMRHEWTLHFWDGDSMNVQHGSTGVDNDILSVIFLLPSQECCWSVYFSLPKFLFFSMDCYFLFWKTGKHECLMGAVDPSLCRLILSFVVHICPIKCLLTTKAKKTKSY